MNLRDADKQLTRSRLVAAAARSFEERGYAATTVDDVATGAGATRATFYLHFRSKADLVQAVMADAREESQALHGHLETAVRQGTRAALAAWIDAAFDYWEHVRGPAAAEAEAATLDPTVRRDRSDSFAAGVDAVVRGLATRPGGGAGVADHRVRAVLVYAQLQNLFARWMEVGWDIDRGRVLEVMTDMWLAALADPLS